MRRSGIGRELGSEGIEDFRDSKHVHIETKIEIKDVVVPVRLISSGANNDVRSGCG